MFLVIFFFLMIRRPPRSTLFPTRRSSDLYLRSRTARTSARSCSAARSWASSLRSRSSPSWRCPGRRSEEHTSELQSRPHLVCRLLLEKKYVGEPDGNEFTQKRPQTFAPWP